MEKGPHSQSLQVTQFIKYPFLFPTIQVNVELLTAVQVCRATRLKPGLTLGFALLFPDICHVRRQLAQSIYYQFLAGKSDHKTARRLYLPPTLSPVLSQYESHLHSLQHRLLWCPRRPRSIGVYLWPFCMRNGKPRFSLTSRFFLIKWHLSYLCLWGWWELPLLGVDCEFSIRMINICRNIIHPDI